MIPNSIHKQEPSFSIFKNATTTVHSGTITLSQAIEKIRSGEWKPQVDRVREVLASQSDEKYKQRRAEILPLFALSGELPSKVHGKTLVTHSGLLQGDFDKKDHPDLNYEQMREIATSSPYVVAAFISPSGSGLKAIIRVPACVASHPASFQAAERHFAELGLKMDAATKDAKRLCYVSYDPDLWSREWVETKILEYQADDLLRALPKPRKSSIIKRSSSMCHTDGIDGIETQTTQIIQKKGGGGGRARPRITDDVEAAKRARAKLKKDARLSKLYRQYIESKFTARQGERNSQLVAMVTFLFRAVSEASVKPLVMFYYDINQDVFSDSREQHEKECQSQLVNTKRTWCESLNEVERRWHDDLAEYSDKRHENAFRVCRELVDEDGTFFLSGAQLGLRIALDSKTAHRILLQFVRHEILAEVRRGTQHRRTKRGGESTFTAGKATVYRWRLRDEPSEDEASAP